VLVEGSGREYDVHVGAESGEFVVDEGVGCGEVWSCEHFLDVNSECAVFFEEWH
jgi:hypothetical protein